jgi:L-fuculose-phosphate aldolase
MQLEKERRAVCSYAQRLRPDGLVVGTSGNVSIRVGDYVAITPASFDYDLLTPALIVVLRLDGEMVEARSGPSSEAPMHLAIYKQCPSVAAVVHTHSPYATVLATLREEVRPLHYLLAELGGNVRVAPYATYGTENLGANAAAALQDRNAVLLANHGAVTVGETLGSAYSRSVLLEWLCTLQYRSELLGDPPQLSAAEIDGVARLLRAKSPAKTF